MPSCRVWCACSHCDNYYSREKREKRSVSHFTWFLPNQTRFELLARSVLMTVECILTTCVIDFLPVFRAEFTSELKKNHITTSHHYYTYLQPHLPLTIFEHLDASTTRTSTHRRHTSTTTQEGENGEPKKKATKICNKKTPYNTTYARARLPDELHLFHAKRKNERTNERSLVIVYLLATCQTCIVSGCSHSVYECIEYR